MLSAFGGAKGARYAKIRLDDYLVAVGDRVPELAGNSAPVFDASNKLVGAFTLTMPTPKLKRNDAISVVDAARQLTQLLGGTVGAHKPD